MIVQAIPKGTHCSASPHQCVHFQRPPHRWACAKREQAVCVVLPDAIAPCQRFTGSRRTPLWAAKILETHSDLDWRQCLVRCSGHSPPPARSQPWASSTEADAIVPRHRKRKASSNGTAFRWRRAIDLHAENWSSIHVQQPIDHLLDAVAPALRSEARPR